MARKRRGNNEGTVTKRADGRWMARISLGLVDGRMQRKSVYGKTREEAVAKMRAVQRELDRGVTVRSSTPMLKEFLQEWLGRKASLAPKTQESYRQIVERHIEPAIGSVRLEKLNQRHVLKLLDSVQATGVKPSTVEQVRRVLRAALGEAMSLDLVTRNVAALVKVPERIKKYEAQALNPHQVDAFHAHAADSQYRVLYLLAFTYGIRQGELIGLRWQDIDFDNRVIRIRKQIQRVDGVLVFRDLKTESSQRDLPLRGDIAAELKNHRTAQIEERLKAGGRWQTQWGLVFSTSIGSPVDTSALRRDFVGILESASLPAIRFHDTRHTATSIMTASGIHPAVIQEILGHTTYAMSKRYTQVSIDTMRDALEMVGT